jgi:glutathione S-transferase
MSVFVALEEKGLPFELELLDLAQGEQHDPDFMRRSITGRVPTLFIAGSAIGKAATKPGAEPSGVWLSESVAITEYLEERFPSPGHPRLYPEDVEQRARVRMVQGLIRSDFRALREERSTETIFQGARSRPLSENAEADRVRLIRVATALVGEGQPSIAGDFSIADVDLATMLQRLVHNRDLISEILVDYARSIWKRPSVEKWLALTQYPG